MDDRSTDIFGPVEENSDDSVEEEEDWKRNSSLKKNKKKTTLVASSKRKEKLRTINQTMIRGIRYAKKWVTEDLKELYWNEVQQFLDRGKLPGKIPNLCRACRFQDTINCLERKTTKDLLRASKMDSPY